MLTPLTYRPEVDGLRAVAVTAVILYHGHILPLPGGFAGVDVFFVLSGFLITAILLRELQQGQFSILRFYERRIRRILPALIVVLAATTAVAVAVMIPSQLLAYGQSLAGNVLFVSNFVFGAKSGYFSPALEEAPLLHTWSLSVEEQFYLAFPPLLALLYHRLPRLTGLVLALLALASLGLAEWGWRNEPDINFFFTFSRAWELLAGTGAALLLHHRRISPRASLAALGMGMILYALLFHSDATPYPSLATLVPVGGTALILLFGTADRGVGRVLARRPFVAVGFVSYSAYLWHQPLFAFARITQTDAPSTPLMAGLTLLTFALAALTWRFVEQPFRRPTQRWLPRTRPLFVAAAGDMAALATLSALLIWTQGNDALWRARHPDQAATLDLILQAGQNNGPPAATSDCRFNLTRLDAKSLTQIDTCAASYGPAVVVLGDSHAIDVYSALSHLSHAPFLMGLTGGGCRPADAAPTCAYDSFATLVAAKPDLFSHILFVQSGDYLLLGTDGRAGSRQLFTRIAAADPVPPFAADPAAVAALLTYLDRLAAHVPTTLLAPRVEPHIPPARVLRAGCSATYALRPGQAQVYQTLDRTLATASAGTRVAYIGLDAQPFDMASDFMTCDTLYWSDGDHWSASGEARFGARLLPVLPPPFQ